MLTIYQKQNQQRYLDTTKGRMARKRAYGRYNRSSKAKEARRRYLNSAKGKEAVAAYRRRSETLKTTPRLRVLDDG